MKQIIYDLHTEINDKDNSTPIVDDFSIMISIGTPQSLDAVAERFLKTELC